VVSAPPILFVPHDPSFLRKLTVALTLLQAITEELRD